MKSPNLQSFRGLKRRRKLRNLMRL